MNYETQGMHRVPDHATSIKAARGVRRFTLREQVMEFARASLAHGFTDDDLKAAQPDRPESSLRKRRTELAQENRLLENGFTRKNRFGQDEKVFVHRDYHPSPPPIIERDTTPKQSKLARAEAALAEAKVVVQQFVNGVETGDIRSDHDEVMASLMARAHRLLAN